MRMGRNILRPPTIARGATWKYSVIRYFCLPHTGYVSWQRGLPLFIVNSSIMSEYQILHFGTVNATAVNKRYDASVDINGSKVTLDLHFDQPQAAPGADATINQFLEKAASYDATIRTAIAEDFDNDGEAVDFVRFFLEDLRPRELKELLGHQEEVKSVPQQLMNKLELVRIGIYADDKNGFFAVYDYTLVINGRPSSQVLAIEVDEQGAVLNIAWEN